MVSLHESADGRRRVLILAPLLSAVTTAVLSAVFVAVLSTIAARPAVAAPGWRWPLEPRPAVVRGFDPPDSPYGSGHRGVDLAARTGQTVYAAGPGVIGFAGVIAGRGVVTVQHANGLKTTYEPVTAAVSVGTAVAAGTPIGVVESGHPGCTAVACLHFGLRRGAAYLDPLRLFGPVRVRLLPRYVGYRASYGASYWAL